MAEATARTKNTPTTSIRVATNVPAQRFDRRVIDPRRNVAHWPMDDDAANTTVVDIAGGNNAAAQQNTSILHTTGQINGALSFNGDDDNVDIGSITGTDDLALALSAMSIRIVAPIPGKDVIGIEIPNDVKESVFLKELVGSKEFLTSESNLTLGLGKDILGNIVVTHLDKMPLHNLV